MAAIYKALRDLCMLLMLMAAPVASGAEGAGEMRSGLMWNRTGLPAVFPLQVRSPVGRDYYLHLSKADTGEPALAAYIRGGGFFKVLVPPGEFRVRFAYGRDWQGEEALFAKSAGVLELDAPLRFAVQGLNRKTGHVIDLRPLVPQRDAAVRVAPVVQCQGVRIVGFDPLAQLYGVTARDLEARAWQLLTLETPEPEASRLRFQYPRLDVRTRVCPTTHR